MADESPRAFYDGLAKGYDAIYDDWWAAAQWHARHVDGVLRAHGVAPPARILDCACGIGTQAIPLAAMGYDVTASDISAESVERARREAATRGIPIQFGVADMRALESVARYDAVIACDNAIPHLLDDRELDAAVGAVANVLEPNGVFLAGVRDYDALRAERPSGVPGVVRERPDGREIVGQAWEWHDQGEQLRIHLFFLRERADGWVAEVHTTWYRALTRAALTAALERNQFTDVTWHSAEELGYYQPVVTARRA